MLSRGFKSFRSWTMIIVLRFNEGEKNQIPELRCAVFWQGCMGGGHRRWCPGFGHCNTEAAHLRQSASGQSKSTAPCCCPRRQYHVSPPVTVVLTASTQVYADEFT